jgi:catalase
VQSSDSNTTEVQPASRRGSLSASSVAGAQPDGTGWVDRPDPPALRAQLSERVAAQQRCAAARNPSLAGRLDRAQHQKQLLGALAELKVDSGLPDALRLGPFQLGRSYRAAVRFSNGQPCPFRDQAPDVRGVAVKFFAHDGGETDLLLTNEEGKSHARSGAPFLDFADILLAAQLQGQRLSAFKVLAQAVRRGTLSVYEAARGTAILLKATSRPVQSCATETYVGSPAHHGALAIRHVLRPHPQTQRRALGDTAHANYLREDLEARLAQAPVRFELGVQIFRDEQSTPINDASIAWNAPFVRVGELVLTGLPSADDEQLVQRLAFNPANGFGSLGITHTREDAYRVSAHNRGAASSEEARHALER